MDHKNHASPVISHKDLERSNVELLNADKKGQQHEVELDGVFLVEEILEKKGQRYHIKWKGYEVTTWEPAHHIPKFIRDYHERTGQGLLPTPRILETRKTGNLNKTSSARLQTNYMASVKSKIAQPFQNSIKFES